MKTTEKRLEATLESLENPHRATLARIVAAQKTLDQELEDNSPATFHEDTFALLVRAGPEHRQGVARAALEAEQRKLLQIEDDTRGLRFLMAAVHRAHSQVQSVDAVAAELAKLDAEMTDDAIRAMEALARSNPNACRPSSQ
jgi:hypothetical protein